MRVMLRANTRPFLRALLLACAVSGAALAEEPAPSAATPEANAEDELYNLGQQLFEQYAPPEVKAEYAFPNRAEWDAFMGRLQGALQGDSLKELAGYGPQGRMVLSALRASGAEPDLADWLEQRLDEIDAAAETQAPPPSPSPPSAKVPPAPPKPPRERLTSRLPHYELWLARVQKRPAPARAAELMPTLRNAFAAEGVTPALAWLAEAESSLNPEARSPVGAKGLFQLMPGTAKHLGLDTFMPDERTDPEKSARAAARYLRQLHARFGNWPLALAAYNAGEGRVSRALASQKAKDFLGISDVLPAETRMYVPKVCALVSVRTGTDLTALTAAR